MDVSLERHYADTHASIGLNDEQHAKWEACRSAHRFMAFLGKELIVYRIFLDKPEILSTLKCVDAGFDFRRGLYTVWKNQNNQEFEVGHVPVMVADSVFLWQVFDSNVQFTPLNGKFSARVSIAYKMAKNPVTKQEGANYILEKQVFRTTFTEA